MTAGNAKVLQNCLERSSAVSPAADSFQLQTRVAFLDRGSYNIAAEAAISKMRASNNWQNMLNFCEIHATSRTFRRTYDLLMGSQVTGLIRCALSLRHASSMAKFRLCLKREVQKRLVVRFGEPSVEARLYRQQVLAIFVNSGTNLLCHRMLLSSPPNGDWRNQEEVQVFLPVGMHGKVNSKQLVPTLVAGLLYCLAGRKPEVYCRHRWGGADLCCEQLARLQAVHGLLGHTYKRFLQESSGKTYSGGSAPTMCSIGGGVSLDLGIDTCVEPDVTHDVTVTASGREARDDGAAAGNFVEVGSEAVERSRSPEEHALDKAKAKEWLQEDPLHFLTLMRLTMHPLTNLLNAQMHHSSQEWELEQRACVVEALENHVEGNHREWMATIAAKCVLEANYYNDLHVLYKSAELWSTIIERHRTIGFNALCFQVLSKQGALVYQELVVRHQAFPYVVFRLLHHPEEAVSLSQRPRCLMDKWSQNLLDKYPGFTHPDLQAVLESHAQMMCTNTSSIECRHGSIRRVIHTRSAQAPAVDIKHMSAEFVLQNCRRNRIKKPDNPGQAGNKKRKHKE
eukprot:6425933-Amphidinium_carterae.7